VAERPESQAASPLQAIRAERDRFVALAFCWADVLMELDADKKVVFAGGPLVPLIGRDAEALKGVALDEVIAEQDRSLVRALLGLARKKGRIENTAVRLQGTKGATQPLSFSGYCLDDLGGHYFLAFRIVTSERVGIGGSPKGRDAENGLYDAESFASVVAERVKAGEDSDEHGQMTLIALPEYETLQGRLDTGAQQDLLNTMGAYLRANSVDGDSAARLGDDRFGLMHDADLDIDELQQKIGDFTREADPTGQGVAVEAATIEIDPGGASEEDLANGLVYAINQFRTAKGKAFSVEQLSTNLSSLVSQAANSVKAFKKVVSDADFQVALQPIIDVMTGQVHHYEALVRFSPTDSDQSPYEQIVFAEETGLIQEFDLAMARKVVEWLDSTPRNSKTSVAVNVSGHSVASTEYMTGLHKLLSENLWLRGRLLFEITESARMTDLAAANQFVQNLRREGYPVCLDDFGAGAANFQYLSTMEVDVVKLDGSAVRNAQEALKGKAFLKSLVGLCRDLGVETVAEMVDDEKGLKFIRECGVQYVQGYLFGKPNTDIKSFDKLRLPSLFPQWLG
jgi:EAL domain-containing protein (putative c-di-GMP-specific phosphodiesterase class I)